MKDILHYLPYAIGALYAAYLLYRAGICREQRRQWRKMAALAAPPARWENGQPPVTRA